LQEERRTRRRTVADAFEVVRQLLGIDEIPRAQIQLGPLRLPSGKLTALVDLVFPDLGCRVSLPTSARFRALTDASSQHRAFKISLLDQAEVCSDGSVLLADRSRLRAVEVIPTHLPYEVSELEERILQHVIARTNSYHCYRSMREDVPEHFRDQIPDIRVLDYSRVRTIQAPPLRAIRAYIQASDPELKVSSQKIADALAMFGVRIPRRRSRAGSVRTAARATICMGIATIRLGSELPTI
jgi:hypothetical protein